MDMLLKVVKYTVSRVKYIVSMAMVDLSPKIASKVAKNYWAKCDKTHGNTSYDSFKFYYKKIIQVMEPTKNDVILDAGCGGGELTYLFHKDGFNVKGFDSSNYLISKANNRFGSDLFYVDNFIDMNNKKEKFTKVFINGAFFYIHPKYHKTALKNLYDIVADGGAVYVFDDPDYSKRNRWHDQYLFNVLTFFFPVYDPYMSGFWVKTDDIKKIALDIGFSKVEKLDSWAYYRSHHILFKGVNR